MHISVAGYGTWGDVLPCMALGEALQRRGHEVRLVVTEDFDRWVRATDLDVRLLGVNKSDVMRDVSSQTRTWRIALALQRRIPPVLLRAGRDLVDVTQGTDVLVVNHWLMGMAGAIAQARSLGLIELAMQPRIPTAKMPIFSWPEPPEWFPLRGGYNRLSYRIAHWFRWWAYMRTANSLRAEAFGLRALTSQEYLDLHERTPTLVAASRHVVPRPDDWASHHQMTGYLFYDDQGWRPPSELQSFLAAGPVPVYIGFGSMHDEDPIETTATILRGLEAAEGERAVMYPGWAGIGQGDLPPDVYRLEYAPHHWLFPRVAAAVHHAGAGTTAAALRAGIPSVPVPHSGDQNFWARRLHDLGAGTELLRRPQLSADALGERIARAVADHDLRRSAGRLGDLIRAEQGAETAAAAVEEFLGQV